MHLLTHNLLRSPMSGTIGEGYPLTIVAESCQPSPEQEVHTIRVSDGDETEEEGGVKASDETLRHLITNGTLNWDVVRKAASQVGLPVDSLPESIYEDMMLSKDFFDALRGVLLGVNVVKGVLVCPTTGRQFPIVDGIPNMMVTEADYTKNRDDKAGPHCTLSDQGDV